jgi:phycoerythrin-associated linker protein
MVSTFLNAPTGERQTQFYQAYQPFKETAPVELYPSFSDAEADLVIRAVYRQVLGNAHVMESERLVVAESQLKRGELSVREFVRYLAKSELYRSRFFDNCYRYRAIEMNYKHLLGRAPDNFEEVRAHSTVLDQSGFEADIDTYLDSDEYQMSFGECVVPYYRGYRTQPGQSMMEFTNMLQLLRSASSSDKNLATQNKAQLTRAIIQNSPYGQLQSSNVEDLMAALFKPQAPAAIAPPTPPPSYAVASVPQTVQEQARMIERLQQQLAELRPFAAIGASYLKSDGQSSSDGNAPSWQRQSDAQAAQIAALQEQVADARRYAAIGEARVNKWRSRTFSR